MSSAPVTAALPLDLEPYTRAELFYVFRGGEPDADHCETVLAQMGRYRGAYDVSLAEHLYALTLKDRLAELGCHLDDYAREVLGIGRRAALELVRLGRDMQTRPLLREALRSGRIRFRAAQTIARVAVGESEALWVERAERMTVRALEAAVRRASPDAADDEEPWLRLRASLEPAEREVLDEALALAGKVLPGSSRIERLEAMAQEFAGEYPTGPDVDPVGPAWQPFHTIGPREDRRARLEAETLRWIALPQIDGVPIRDFSFCENASASVIDANLRQIVRDRAQVNDLLGYCAVTVKKSELWRIHGFASFRHYVEERLGLSARTVEELVYVEEKRWESPALREAKRQGLGFEKLRLLSRLRTDEEIEAWAPRAEELTCVALRRELEAETERQTRARRKLSVALPLRVAVVLAAAVQAVKERLGRCVPAGKCLAIVAQYCIDVWSRHEKRRSRAQKVRDRDLGRCKVPGCSHPATQTHHVLYRSQGGGHESGNQIGLCAFHHLRCIHGGWLRVVGKAPDELRWFLNGEPWEGPKPAVGA